MRARSLSFCVIKKPEQISNQDDDDEREKAHKVKLINNHCCQCVRVDAVLIMY